ncbi:MAG: selenocysteine-specific translation elongation factor [Chloroflexota bacterium]
MRVIGTAGHVDHGKSTLVRRLTGIEPDRWAEEQARGLTIDLGFAWFDLPDGETVGIVDVPGHRDFIENMLAGIGGIDVALPVIAADEGVMPQTREHLAILDLLGIQNGIVLLTKTDLIEDPEWLDLVELDVQEVLEHTTLENAPILRISAHTGEGIDDLVNTLTEHLSTLPQRTDYNQPHLPIDRVFSVDGFGTVVTGTLSGGTLHIGDTVDIQPSGKTGRVRGLQSYKQDIETALPGSRVAVNIAGLSTDDIQRGDVLAYLGQLHPTQLIDVHFRHLADADRPLKHNAKVKFFSGASETMATVRLLNDETLHPNNESWLQLRLRDAIPLTQRDRFILRYPSPPQTIGGGIIIDPNPKQRWKRFQPNVISRLETLYEGTPAERVTQATDTPQPQTFSQLQKTTAYDDAQLQDAIQSALDEQKLVQVGEGQFWAFERLLALQSNMLNKVTDYHTSYPLRLGIPREELRRRLETSQALLSIILTENDTLVAQDDIVRHHAHTITFSTQQKQAIAQLDTQIADNPHQPPSYKEAVAIVSEDVLKAKIALGDIVQISPDVIFATADFEGIVQSVLRYIEENGTVDVKTARDLLGTSRKYAIAILEYTDAQKITRRVGDERVRG